MGRQNQTKPDINVVSDAQQAAITALLAGQTTEQAAAAAEVGGDTDTLLASIPLAGWKVILANGERGALLCAASLGAESLRLWLAERGIVPAAL